MIQAASSSGRDEAERSPVGLEHVDMRMRIEQLSCGLDEPDGSRGDVGAIEVGAKVELQGSPGTAGEFAQELSVVTEEDPQPLGDGEDHLAVGDVFEQFALGPVRPRKLALLMAGTEPKAWSGHKPRSLQEKATRNSCRQSGHRTRATPWSKMPQSRYRWMAGSTQRRRWKL